MWPPPKPPPMWPPPPKPPPWPPPPPPPPRAKASEAPRPPARAAANKTIIILRTTGILLLTRPSSKTALELFMTGQHRLRASFRSNIRAWKCVRDDIGAIKLIVRIQLSSGPETGRNEQRAGQGHVCCE